MTKPRYFRRPSWWRRICHQLDAHPVLIIVTLVSSSYVGILAAQCIRHYVTGAW
jgi:hypothetical protein